MHWEPKRRAIAMPMLARWRDQHGEFIQDLQGCESENGWSIGLRLRETVKQNPALQILAEILLDVRGNRGTFLILVPAIGQPGFERQPCTT
ncbi:MAG: hypothetical protein ACRERU_02245 [Methylococcales bacterium]